MSVFYFVGFGSPPLEGFDCFAAVYTDTFKMSINWGAVEFLIYKFIGEIDGVGVFFGIAVEDFFDTGPIERTEAHRAWLATAVYDAVGQFEIVETAASVSDCHYLCVNGGVVDYGDGIDTCCYDVAVAYYDGGERTAPFVDVFERQLSRYIHIFFFKVRVVSHDGFAGQLLQFIFVHSCLY